MTRGASISGTRRSARRLCSCLCLLAVLLIPTASGESPVPSHRAATFAVSAVVPVPADPDHPGALALQAGSHYTGRPDTGVRPSPAQPAPDWVPTPSGPECRTPAPGPPLLICARATPWPPTRRIVVVGDSHAQQYAGALEASAEQNHWQIVTMLRGACPFSTESETVPGSRDCVEWNAAARAEIRTLRPDLVVTTASRNVRVGLTEVTPPGFVRAWRELADAGIPVFAIRDSPRYDYSPAECMRRNGAGSPICDVARSALLAPTPPYTVDTGVPTSVTFFDPSDCLCTTTTCSPTVGNVLVYFDDNHLTASFTRTLGPMMTEQLLRVLNRDRTPPPAPTPAEDATSSPIAAWGVLAGMLGR